MEEITIQQALADVMRAVGGIAKKDRNQSQGFNFRGIDAVVNAVSPALQKYGVLVIPSVEDYEYSTVEIGKNRTAMGHAKVKVTYSFIGPKGDAIRATVVAEAMDAGDKASAKAMSVAFRTALLQALCLPTDEIDPDANSYERSEVKSVNENVSGVLEEISKASNTLELAVVGEFLTKNKKTYSQENLEILRLAFIDKQNELNNRKKETLNVAVDS